MMKSNVYARNMKVLRRRMPVLAKAMEMIPPSGCEYIVEEAKDGSMTLAIRQDDKVYQVHSKYNPQREAAQQIENSKLVNPKLLLVLGLGLGYHLRACLEQLKEKNLFIVLIEKDVDALRDTLSFTVQLRAQRKNLYRLLFTLNYLVWQSDDAASKNILKRLPCG